MMALEPITRQEQIIAGKDLQPITRMERFLKEYGGGSGGVVSDEQIKKAVGNYLDENPIGVDLSVTGATVGQTVKITAVDDKGVPTAWEPADFPSGGGSAYQVLIDEAGIGSGANYVKCFDIPENANVLFLFWTNVSGDVFLTSNNADTINWSNRTGLGNLGSHQAFALLFRVGDYWRINLLYGISVRAGILLTAGYKNLAIYFNTALTADVAVCGGVLA